MKLIKPGLNHSCAMCGGCCREKWKIQVDKKDMESLKKADWSKDLPKGKKLFKKRWNMWVMETEGNEGCVLMRDNKCLVHARLGIWGKAASCIIFPYIFTETPDGTYLGLSYACPEAASNRGKALQEQDFERIARLSSEHGRTIKSRLSLHDRQISWDTYKLLEEKLAQILKVKAPLRHRLLYCHILIEETEDKVEKLDEYLRTLDIEGLIKATDKKNPAPEKRKALLATAITLLSHQRDQNPLKAIATYIRYIQDKDDGLSTAVWEDNEPAERYFAHIIERKSLVRGGDITDNANMLILAYSSLEWLSVKNAQKGGRKRPSIEDVTDAIAAVEKSIFTHDMTYMIMMKSQLTNMLMAHFFNDPDYARIMLGD
ncbi:MAG: YkgJ family cysteine cluster protein [Candidatus Altiarchaeota archaeon]